MKRQMSIIKIFTVPTAKALPVFCGHYLAKSFAACLQLPSGTACCRNVQEKSL